MKCIIQKDENFSLIYEEIEKILKENEIEFYYLDENYPTNKFSDCEIFLSNIFSNNIHELYETKKNKVKYFIFLGIDRKIVLNKNNVFNIYIHQPLDYIKEQFSNYIKCIISKENLEIQIKKLNELRNSYKEYSEKVKNNIEQEKLEILKEKETLKEANRMVRINVLKLEEEKRKAEDMTRFVKAVIDLLPVGIMILDFKFNVKMWNKELERMSRIKREKILFRNIITALPKFKKIGLINILEEVRDTKKDIFLEEFVYTEDDRTYIYKIIFFIIGGNDIGVIFDNITQQAMMKEYSVIGGMSFYISHMIRNSISLIGGFFNKLCLLNGSNEKNDDRCKYQEIIKTEINKIEAMVFQMNYFHGLILNKNIKKESKISLNKLFKIYYMEIKFKRLFFKREKKILPQDYFECIEIQNSEFLPKEDYKVKANLKSLIEAIDFFLKDIIAIKPDKKVILTNIKYYEKGDLLIFDLEFDFLKKINVSLNTLFSPWQHSKYSNDITSWGFAIAKKSMQNMDGDIGYKVSNDKTKIVFKFSIKRCVDEKK